MAAGSGERGGAARRVLRGRVGVSLVLIVAMAGAMGTVRAASPAYGGGPLPRELGGTWSILTGDRTLPGHFENPTGLAVDAAGNIYVDDTQNFRIQKLTPSGKVQFAFGDAGTNYGQFQFANGVAVDRAGNVYVADAQNARIQKFSPRGFPLAVWDQMGSAPGEFKLPTDIAVDRAGDMYVVDAGDLRIQKLSPEGKPLAIWASAPSGALHLSGPHGITVSHTGTVYVSDSALGTITKISPQGRVLAVWGGRRGSGQEFLHPKHLAVDASGRLYVADMGHHRVVELSATGKELRVWYLGRHASPNGIALTPAKTLLVADTRRSAVLQLSLSSSKVLSTWGNSERAAGELFFPSAVATGPAGILDVANEGNARIEQVPVASGSGASPSAVWSLPGRTAGRVGQPVSMAVDSAGDIYVVDGTKNGVAKLRSNGTLVRAWPAAHTAPLGEPIGVTVDPAGDVYIADAATSQIWRFSPSGRLLGRWGKGKGKAAGQFRFDELGTAGLAADHQGHIYVTDTNNSRVEKFTTGGKLLAVWSRIGGYAGRFDHPEGVATDPQGNVYVADTGGEAIEELSASGALLAQWGSWGTATGQFREPTGIAADASGRIFVADSNNDRIQVYAPLASAIPAAAPVRVSGPSPFADCTKGVNQFGNVNHVAETRLAVNPATAGTAHVGLIGAWIQDFGHDVVAAYSKDGGATWQESPLPFSSCVAGGLPFQFSGDPWVSIGPDGTAYLVGLGDTFDQYDQLVADGIELATSSDGGKTWANVQAVARGSAPHGLKTEVDKPTVVADPIHRGVAYAFWDSYHRKAGYTGWMIKTTDGGKTWTAPAAFLPAHPNHEVIALHQPLIDPRTGTIYDFFSYARIYSTYVWHCHKVKGRRVCGTVKSRGGVDYVAFVRSNDSGATWSAPGIIAHRPQAGLPSSQFGAPIRTGVGIDVAMSPADGSLHAVWADPTESTGAYDEVFTSSSSDGGATWSPPVRVTQLPAFNPSVAVNDAGTVAVTYYAARSTYATHVGRQLSNNPSTVVAYMLQTSSNGGATFGDPRPVFGSFNVNQAVVTHNHYFLGDYQGLVAVGSALHPFFVAGNASGSTDPVDVFTSTVQP